MRGFVPTPKTIVDLMVAKLFARNRPQALDSLLEPGCGPGALIEGVLEWCRRERNPAPAIVGVENSPSRYAEAATRFERHQNVAIANQDFLKLGETASFEYIISNPPYVPINALNETEKAEFRAEFTTARGRFDLYMLFFEKSLRLLAPGGRVVLVSPEKFLYVHSARTLRRLLGGEHVVEIHQLPESAFGSLGTYPTITTVDKRISRAKTLFLLRDGSRHTLRFPRDGSPPIPQLHMVGATNEGSVLLGELCRRISCGVATGADDVFVHQSSSLPAQLREFAYQTISGRQLSTMGVDGPTDVMLVPYDREGKLRSEAELTDLLMFLQRDDLKTRLDARTRTSPWYSFHDTANLRELLRPKILCKDITPIPQFWLDRRGTFVPRHSVYYIVPANSDHIEPLLNYLNSSEAASWLTAHAQRAANGCIRLQSETLKRLPVPADVLEPPVRVIFGPDGTPSAGAETVSF